MAVDVAATRASRSATPGGRSRPRRGTFEYYGGAANKLFGEVAPGGQTPGLGRGPPGAGRRVRPDRAVELPAADRRRGRWRRRWPAGTPSCSSPPRYTPLTALMLGELLVEAGVPPEGASRCCPARAASVGDALVGDPRVHKICFTGETTTGTPDPAAVGPTTSPGCRSSSAGSRPASCSPTPTSSGPRPRLPMAVFGNAGQDCCARSRVAGRAPGLRRLRRRLRPPHRGRGGRRPDSTAGTEMGPADLQRPAGLGAPATGARARRRGPSW